MNRYRIKKVLTNVWSSDKGNYVKAVRYIPQERVCLIFWESLSDSMSFDNAKAVIDGLMGHGFGNKNTISYSKPNNR